MSQARELKEPTEEWCAHLFEDNFFEWYFSVLGPPGTELEGGIYYGRILLPTKYRKKPPIIKLTAEEAPSEGNGDVLKNVNREPNQDKDKPSKSIDLNTLKKCVIEMIFVWATLYFTFVMLRFYRII